MNKINTSYFDLSNEVKTSFEMGQLVPVCWLDVVPGDKIKIDTSSIIRFQPLLSPSMHIMHFNARYYYIPYRLLVEFFTEIMTDPEDVRKIPNLYDYLKKYNLLSDEKFKKGTTKDTLIRAFGITGSEDISKDSLQKISQLPFRAYHLVYNYFYRDPILDPLYNDNFLARDFDDYTELLQLKNANWRPDYFTTAAPNTQYGSAVDLDIDGSTTISVEEMRLASRLQVWKEKILQAGNRYVDTIQSFFGVRPNDYTVNRPQYLGGFSRRLSITDVEQTVPSTSTNDPLGTLGGKSVTSFDSDKPIQVDCYEHGIILGLAFVRPMEVYKSGIPRSFIKRDYFDFYNPLFANLGMQEVLGCELAQQRTDVFGYQERYAEYKYNNSVVTSDFAEDLEFWHLARNINGEQLSRSFQICRPSNRIFAVTDSVEQVSFNLMLNYFEFDASILPRSAPKVKSFNNSSRVVVVFRPLDGVATELNAYMKSLGYKLVYPNTPGGFVAHYTPATNVGYNSLPGTNKMALAFNNATYKICNGTNANDLKLRLGYGIEFSDNYIIFPDFALDSNDTLTPYREYFIPTRVDNRLLLSHANVIKAIRPIPKKYTTSLF